MNAIGRLCCLVIKFTAVRARILVSYKLHLSSSSPSITSKIYQIFFPNVLSEVLWPYHLHLQTQKFSFISLQAFEFCPVIFNRAAIIVNPKPVLSIPIRTRDMQTFKDFESIIYALFWWFLHTFVMKISPFTWFLSQMLRTLADFHNIILTCIS